MTPPTTPPGPGAGVAQPAPSMPTASLKAAGWPPLKPRATELAKRPDSGGRTDDGRVLSVASTAGVGWWSR